MANLLFIIKFLQYIFAKFMRKYYSLSGLLLLLKDLIIQKEKCKIEG